MNLIIRIKQRVKRLLWIAIAILILLLAKILTFVVPFKKLQWLIGKAKLSKEQVVLSKQQVIRVNFLSWLIRKYSRKIFWSSVCLDKAVAAVILLRLFKIKYTFHLGLAKINKLKAHAWVCCGELTVTGANVRDEYTEISVFN